MTTVNNFFNSILVGVPSIIGAILLLILAYIVAKLAQNLVVKALRRAKKNRPTDKVGVTDERANTSIDFVGKLVFLIIFLLFMPGVLQLLGITSAAAPISNFVNLIISYIPNILAAAIILILGFFIAGLVRSLLESLFRRLNVDRAQERIGMKPAEGGASLSSALSYVVYVIILIPAIIAALQVLNIAAISVPAVNMLNQIFNYLPNIFVAVFLVLIGALIARIAGQLLTQVLASMGTDNLARRWVGQGSFSLSRTIGEVVRYIIILLFVVEAANVINLSVLRAVGNAILMYLPFAISAVIIIGGAILLANWVETMLLKRSPQARGTAMIAKTAIIVIAAFMALNQLGIAPAIVAAAFIITLGALAVAFAISFGIGGREFAARTLNRLESRQGELRNQAPPPTGATGYQPPPTGATGYQPPPSTGTTGQSSPPPTDRPPRY